MCPSTAVHGRGELTAARLTDVHQLLATVCSAVHRTRRGRQWDVCIHGRPILVHVEPTTDFPHEAEDDLLAADVWPDDYPFRVVLAAGCNGRADHDAVRELAVQLSELIGGPFTEPTK